MGIIVIAVKYLTHARTYINTESEIACIMAGDSLAPNTGHIKVPDNLEELVMLISREVIRSQPDNIPVFISELLNKMMQMKEGRLSADSINEPWVKFFSMDNFELSKN